MKLLRTTFLFFILFPIWKYIELAKHKSKWRKKNQHNWSHAKNLFPIEKVTVGNRTYGDIEFYFFGGEHEELRIGSYCSIAGYVRFLGEVNTLETICLHSPLLDIYLEYSQRRH